MMRFGCCPRAEWHFPGGHAEGVTSHTAIRSRIEDKGKEQTAVASSSSLLLRTCHRRHTAAASPGAFSHLLLTVWLPIPSPPLTYLDLGVDIQPDRWPTASFQPNGMVTYVRTVDTSPAPYPPHRPAVPIIIFFFFFQQEEEEAAKPIFSVSKPQLLDQGAGEGAGGQERRGCLSRSE